MQRQRLSTVGLPSLPNAEGGPLVSLTYETEAEARAAHALMAMVIVGSGSSHSSGGVMIAAALNARGIATARGGKWEAATVANVLRRVG